jgi:uncharacterized protein (TIGR02145 family)
MRKFIIVFMLIFSIAKLNAQEYEIRFAGSGASSRVDRVKIENLTQGTSKIISGTSVLLVPSINTGIDPISEGVAQTMRIYPNPMSESCTIEFFASNQGKITLEISDITGKKIIREENSTLAIGKHYFKVSGLISGIYILKIYSDEYLYVGHLISKCTNNSNLTINYQGLINKDHSTSLKSAQSEVSMAFRAGDLLLFTGTSGIYNTIIVESPAENKTITFNFVACTDADGNNYPIVQIGKQTWMAKNLKTTKYYSGNEIPNVTTNSIWGGLTTGAYCDYKNDKINSNTYGHLYNWYAATDKRNVAPIGWHVPTEKEWTDLISYLSDDFYAADQLKETGIKHWDSPNSSATNVTGFTGLPAGMRDSKGNYGLLGKVAYWWSSTDPDSFGAWLQGLQYDTGYSYQGYNGKMFGYSIRCLLNVAPTLSTKAVNNITTTTAMSGGKVTSDGGAPVIARGVCWSLNPNPTIADEKTIDGMGIGSFTSKLTMLKVNTTYYLRAYVTNYSNTYYGNEVSFRTVESDTLIVKDVDGNVYPTITIGNQIWMTENLRTTRYRNGDPIPNVTDGNEWSILTSGAFCNYENDIENFNTYGLLYNWYAVSDKHNITPDGWHIATSEEWTTLFNYLGGPGIAEGKLKESDTTHWDSPNTGATNATGFTALPGGSRIGGTFLYMGSAAYWWSATENSNAIEAFRINLSTGYTISSRNKAWGYSIRCIKDKEL